MELKKVLLFTGKFPSFGDDTDGGSILIYSLIQALKNNCILDVIFTRTPRKGFEVIEGVRKVSFETYDHHLSDKFARRLANKEQLFSRLRKEIAAYDTVIITHCSKAFGIERLSAEERSKIVLFPMYLSPSYKRSGEYPPDEYIAEECSALCSAGKILTPSDSEKQDMIRVFGIDENKIKVIPRGYSSYIKPVEKQTHFPIELLYIASIKEQKNTKEAIVLLKELSEHAIDVRLHLAGSYQNDSVLSDCHTYITANGLSEKVIFHGVLPQKELAALIAQAPINISVSNWETYGRGIFEGMAGGLPTVVFDHLECVKQYVTDGEGISFVLNHEAFLSKLIELCTAHDYYSVQARKAIRSVDYLSEAHEQERLIKELL